MHEVELSPYTKEVTIKELRVYYGITQEQLSKITGIPKRTIGNWESGSRSPAPYITELVRAKLELEAQKSLK